VLGHYRSQTPPEVVHDMIGIQTRTPSVLRAD
jgi:hypothetical protein